MDYLVINWIPHTTANLLQLMLQCWILDRLSPCSAASMARKVQDVLDSSEKDRRSVLWVDTYLAFESYEKVEGMSVLEMALWKKQLYSGRRMDRSKRMNLDPQQCLHQCGS
mmetsp:Transcript_45813/g.111037  ORF Transcript_45813/g.111037 Transcript_45813/m.111037 type:complete len:111 (+) Transcript_45813:996-1328(+)